MATTSPAEVCIQARQVYTIFENDDGFCVAKYKAADGKQFTAVGPAIPSVKDCDINLYGQWESSAKWGRQFKVAYYEMQMPSSEKGIVSYIVSLKVHIGRKRAKEIYNRFQDDVWRIIDDEPERLTEIKGISKKTVARLSAKVAETRALRNIIAGFKGYCNMDMRKARKIQEKFGDDALATIVEHPYWLCRIEGFTFASVDDFALRNGADPRSPERIVNALVQALDSIRLRGHVCVPGRVLVSTTEKLVDAKKYGIQREVVAQAIRHAFKRGRIKGTKTQSGSIMFYSAMSFEQEVFIAEDVAARLKEDCSISGIEKFINKFQKSSGMQLADKQREALETVFKSPVSIITGGPGTGKTATTKAVLFVNDLIYGNTAKPVLLAPTGKAARRMTESTGYSASTIHSAIGYVETESGRPESMEEIDGNLIIVDESSMMDQTIACLLLKSISKNARIVFVGDPQQLPSVGAGDVLRNMILSDVVPCTELKVIYRQGADSPIITNAHKINAGDTDLMWTPEFKFFEEHTPEAIFDRTVRLYLQCVKRRGLDSVILLNPYRVKSNLSVNAFNRTIHELVNPHKDNDPVIKVGPIEFRAGDKVMQTRNTDAAKNGDVGYIVEIDRSPSEDDPLEYEYAAYIEFNGDGNRIRYTEDDMRDLDLAYCMTIHKSQGSQYETVLMVMSHEHEVCLKRNLIYTGITRSEKFVAIIGEKSAVDQAILTNDADKRYTMLTERLIAAAGQQ